LLASALVPTQPDRCVETVRNVTQLLALKNYRYSLPIGKSSLVSAYLSTRYFAVGSEAFKTVSDWKAGAFKNRHVAIFINVPVVARA